MAVTVRIKQSFLSGAAQAAALSFVADISRTGVQARVIRDPSTLLALTSDEVTAIFSAPALRHVEGTVERWQYRAEGCLLDVYVSTPDGAGEKMVIHFETRAPGRAYFQRPGSVSAAPAIKQAGPDGCLARIAEKSSV